MERNSALYFEQLRRHNYVSCDSLRLLPLSRLHRLTTLQRSQTVNLHTTYCIDNTLLTHHSEAAHGAAHHRSVLYLQTQLPIFPFYAQTRFWGRDWVKCQVL